MFRQHLACSWPLRGLQKHLIYRTTRAAPARSWRTHLHVDQRGHQGGEFSLHPEPQAGAGASAPGQEHVAEENLPEAGAAGADAAEGPRVDAQAASPCQARHRGQELGARGLAGRPPGAPQVSHSSECSGQASAPPTARPAWASTDQAWSRDSATNDRIIKRINSPLRSERTYFQMFWQLSSF